MRVAAVIAFCVLPALVSAQGLQAEDPSALQEFPKAAVDRGISMPPRVMLQGVPTPGNQWRTSTCVAWAVAYAAGSHFHCTRLKDASAALSPAFAYALGNRDARCLATSRVSRMLDVLRDVGGLPLSEYAYDPGWCGCVPTDEERRRAAAFRIPGWAVVPGLDPTAAKLQLAAGRVVIFSMGVGPAFDAHRGQAVFDVLETGPDVYGHAMVAVGYDDEMQAFRIQNSAGTGWGDGGQAWLSYRAWRERAVTAYVITEQPSPTPAAPVQANAELPQVDAVVLERFKASTPAKFVFKRGSLDEVLSRYLGERTHRALALSFVDGGFWR